MKRNYYLVLWVVAFLAGNLGVASAQNRLLSTATFEDLALEPGSYWFYNPDANPGSFKSGSFTFNNSWADYDGFIYWEAFAYSNLTLGVDDLDNYDIQYGNPAAGGADGSSTFAVSYWSSFGNPPLVILDEPAVVQGIYLNNSLYAYSSMVNGDSYSGGPFEQGDYLKVIFTPFSGVEPHNELRVECYLADYRSENPAEHYILTEWTWFDLSEMGNIQAFTLSLEGSRTGDYGLNTPAYLCIDNLGASNPTHISEIANRSFASIYTTNESIHIETALSNYQIRIHSANGSLIHHSTGCRNTKISTSAWPKGVYIIEISSLEGKETKKIVR